ncbi:gp16 family phage-associated protein [Pseudomonas psychrotolerans]|nr:gp16 family phage-associated protein [Pseudomonas psychrotolerans]
MADTYATEQACKEARTRLELQGISVKEFALRHQLNPSTVYAVLNGQKKCLRGEARRPQRRAARHQAGASHGHRCSPNVSVALNHPVSPAFRRPAHHE